MSACGCVFQFAVYDFATFVVVIMSLFFKVLLLSSVYFLEYVAKAQLLRFTISRSEG